MKDARIRVIEESEWRAYRDIRMAALKEAPYAFGSTYENASTYSDQEWEARCKNIDYQVNYPLVAVVDGDFVGIVWAKIEQLQRYICNIYQMWVSPEYRGFGLAKKLLEESVSWARANEVETVLLSVTVGSTAAQQLYKSVGFCATGNPEPLREESKLLAQPMMLLLNKT